MLASALRILIVPTVAILAAMPAHAEVYTWTDEDGITHYTDKPREDGAAEEWANPDLTNSPMEMPEPGTWEPEREEESSDDDQAAVREQVSAQERRCRQYEARLDRINEELGRGYREPRGNKLRAKRRKLRSTMFSEC